MAKIKYQILNDKSWLLNKYWVEKRNTYRIAKEMGCTPQTVLNALKRQNIQKRTRSQAHEGWPSGMLGKHHSKETKKKVGKSLRGNKNSLGCSPSAETKRKLSSASIKMWDVKGRLSIIQRKMNHTIGAGIGVALHGVKAGRHWETLVGYTLLELMQTLEKEFRDGMCWENYGAFWHIDHIIPLAHFHYDSPEDPEFKKAWALGNLQPLLVEENLKKHTKFMFF